MKLLVFLCRSSNAQLHFYLLYFLFFVLVFFFFHILNSSYHGGCHLFSVVKGMHLKLPLKCNICGKFLVMNVYQVTKSSSIVIFFLRFINQKYWFKVIKCFYCVCLDEHVIFSPNSPSM